MEPQRIGIIGVGQIGKQHLETYAKLQGVEVVAAADVNVQELERTADKYGIRHRYTDFRELLAREDIQAVDVCLHNNFHAPVTIAALRAGKHVYCEKPIAGSYTDGKAMVDCARETGNMLHIQLGTLYTKETKAAKALIADGKLGKLYHARSMGFRRRGRPYVDGYGAPTFVKKEISAGGALFDMGVYHISQLLYLLDLPVVERVSGKTYQETDMDPVRREASGYSVEELGLGFIRFAGGLTMDMIEAWAIQLNGFEGSSIIGSQGGVRLSPFSFHTTLSDMDMNATFDLDAMDYRWHQLRENQDAYDSSQSHWLAALQGRAQLLPTAQIALSTMLISEGIYLSEKLGREVTSEEIAAASVSTAIKL
ncbi:Gfo/Idh/MocA family protein [Paenibacillus sp. R14(2021)]|uniref:Gfo/Idh/MocA family protein n=1 Tax=Paenibacillus sp. R14(2021) TaxID=2859228 RepID=UPI001C61653B|nr:Gfo/Idh/MocA family oxidoreductase [Paenibacillus sp. R14(2021)]